MGKQGWSDPDAIRERDEHRESALAESRVTEGERYLRLASAQQTSLEWLLKTQANTDEVLRLHLHSEVLAARAREAAGIAPAVAA